MSITMDKIEMLATKPHSYFLIAKFIHIMFPGTRLFNCFLVCPCRLAFEVVLAIYLHLANK